MTINLKEKLDTLKQNNLNTVHDDIENIKILFDNKYLYESLVYIKQCTMEDVHITISYIKGIKIKSEVELGYYDNEAKKVTIYVEHSGNHILSYTVYPEGYIRENRIINITTNTKKEADIIRKVSRYATKNPDRFNKAIENKLDRMIKLYNIY